MDINEKHALLADLAELLGPTNPQLDQVSQIVDRHVQPATNAEARVVTILLADIRGFTHLTERYHAQQIVEMLNTFFTRMNRIIHKYDGIIDKYMGDSIMALFGALSNNSDDAMKAVACAIEMQLAMDTVNLINADNGLPEIFIGIGINTGSVSAGHVGSDLHNEYTVIGANVNLASRIEAHSLRGQVLISKSSYEIVKDMVQIGHRREVSVKGKTEPVCLYEVKGIHWGGKDLEVPSREIRGNIRVELDTDFFFQVVKDKGVSSTQYEGQLKDISYNGLFAVIGFPVEPYTDIRMRLALSLFSDESREIYGKVMSVRKLESGYGCGIEFTSIDEESQIAINHFIDRLV